MRFKTALITILSLILVSVAFAEVQISDKTGVFPETYRNEVYLRTGERGCNTCHPDSELYELSQRAGPRATPASEPKLHAMANMRQMYGQELNVIYCLTCHGDGLEGGMGPKFGEALHNSHIADRGFTGDCFSCHAVNPKTGDLVLWDRIKYDVTVTSGWPNIRRDENAQLAPLNTPQAWLKHRGNYEGYLDGFTMDPEIKGTLTFSQTKKTLEKDQFVAFNYGAPDEFLPKDLEKNYTVTVTGPYAEKTKVYTLADLRKFKQVKQTFTRPCAINPPGGAMIYNTDFEGVLTMDLLKDAGLKPGANFLKITSYDGWQSPASIRTVEERNGQLSLKIRGETLKPELGGPVSSGIPGESGGANTMWVKTIEIMKVDDNLLPPLTSQPWEGIMESSNAGFFTPARDAEVFSGKKAVLEGWAYAWHNIKVSRLSFSFDNGRSWKYYNVPGDLDPLLWVNWKLDWEPPKPGIYLLKVRAHSDSHKITQLTEASRIVVVK